MGEARLKVVAAGPLVTVQDAGRTGYMRFGVAASGPMDRLSHAAGNVALGNAPEASGIEISMGGLVLECVSGTLSLAVTGADCLVETCGDSLGSWNVISLSPGERLSIRAGHKGSWAYLAFAGNLESQEWLGHSATHSTSGFGGGALSAGQVLTVRDAALREDRHGAIERPAIAASEAIRVVMGPQDRFFDPSALSALQEQPFRLSAQFDRMGVRLDGPKLSIDGALSIPSEPVAKGAIQVAGDGTPTVLLADHQTTGGYPKIATVISTDLDRISQMRAGDVVHFEAVSPEQAVSIARDKALKMQVYLEEVAVPRGTLAQRLMRENLISGAVSETPD
ncbi:biotin-dependent carboxyltransferase family protein [Cognatishimia activa]|uniref:KipI antagonist n=1 Tax=Cognatishimia activa TaxID=1715691 RepID=A0A0P1IXL7_9RHOB|nr:biotin-dependent carboxyltransferase family protein [Cognatishimia activa]CUI75040.1 KipI antagonist [Cognatishimia activa]CUK26695.1 KipI antagonist [Cognatishimia activa]